VKTPRPASGADFGVAIAFMWRTFQLDNLGMSHMRNTRANNSYSMNHRVTFALSSYGIKCEEISTICGNSRQTNFRENATKWSKRY
jgi:hypothetical protein